MAAPITVQESMRRNAELRNEHVRDSDLVTLDELNANTPTYDDGSGAVLSVNPLGKPSLLTQTEFNDRFDSALASSCARKVLRVPNIVLCGGSVFRMFCGDGSMGNSDLDYYVVGMDAGCERSLWAKVDEVLAVFRESSSDPSDTAVRFSKNVITVSQASPGRPKQQLILRVYPTMASVIQAFDVDPCCMAYDGQTTYLTHSAARALVTKRMILDPSRRSLTYEARLAKYMNRGVDMILPHLEMRPDMANSYVIMPHLKLLVHDFKAGVAEVQVLSDLNQPASDYDEDEQPAIAEPCMAAKIVFERSLEHFFQMREDRMSLVTPLDKTAGLMETVIRRGFMVAEDMLPESLVYPLYHFPEWDTIKWKKRNRRTHGVNGYVFYDLDRDIKLDMWIKAEPGRQWTASMNPAFEDPEKYYGIFYSESPKRYESAESESDEDEEPGPDDDVCMICHRVIKPGETNVMVLLCGHKLHMMPMGCKCLGGFDWISDNETCPLCRRPVCASAELAPRPVPRSERARAAV